MTYTRTVENFPLKDAMAVAVAVDRMQSFVKAGNESYDLETDTHTLSNRMIALDTLRQMASVSAEPLKLVGGVPAQICLPTEDDYADAGPIFTYFDEQVVMSKLGAGLDFQAGINGAPNTFNFNLSAIFTSGAVDTNKELGMIASLPHSRRIAEKRVMMVDFNSANRANGYISEMKRRLDITGKVMDIKLIPHQKLNLVTVFTSENKIAKFFMSEARGNLNSLDGEEIKFLGTVKAQTVNGHTGCQETMFNRVVIK
jgi:hypothetical protein